MRLNLATQINSPAHYAKGTPSPLAGLRLFVSMWFQVLLTPLVGVLFTIQSPYWFTIGRQRVFSLAGWSPQFHAGFHESDATLEHPDCSRIHLQDCHLLWCDFPDASISAQAVVMGSATPGRSLVWADPVSLAATHGIDVSFFSSGY